MDRIPKLPPLARTVIAEALQVTPDDLYWLRDNEIELTLLARVAILLSRLVGREPSAPHAELSLAQRTTPVIEASDE